MMCRTVEPAAASHIHPPVPARARALLQLPPAGPGLSRPRHTAKKRGCCLVHFGTRCFWGACSALFAGRHAGMGRVGAGARVATRVARRQAASGCASLKESAGACCTHHTPSRTPMQADPGFAVGWLVVAKEAQRGGCSHKHNTQDVAGRGIADRRLTGRHMKSGGRGRRKAQGSAARGKPPAKACAARSRALKGSGAARRGGARPLAFRRAWTRRRRRRRPCCGGAAAAGC